MKNTAKELPPLTGILAPVEGLFAVVDPQGHIVHTTVSTRPEESVKEFMGIEQAINSMFAKKPLASWEVHEAEGYRVTRVSLVHTPNELYP